ncbi:ParB-like nuclease domain protein [Gordonia phage Lilbeanie]|uniref:ParB-like nuclease domain protein n=1 Tax=Gordonia phage Lilbeanie TaxID=2794947 RepID=A0A7T1NWB4_9CAUD|nr:ParB-like partition protein [Gordonia phage Lilbeanie]QPO17166.1 ParB-like nuclease domain protein [Gordonia phage Lilbeanie]
MPKTTIPDLGEIRTVPIKTVKPAPDNPRRIPSRAIEVVAESLRTFGWQQPLVVDTDNMLIVGHTRLLAAQSLGLTEVPVVVADKLTPDEVRAYRIADNRTGDFTSWDMPELVKQLDDLADDFGDVLALQDWETVVADFEDMQNDVPLPDGEDDAVHDPSRQIALVVVFETREQRAAAAAKIVDMEGVFDVRDKHN